MNYKAIVLAMLVMTGPLLANVTGAVQNTVGSFLDNDPYKEALKRENSKGYFERLEERRNIPETKEEWFDLLRKTAAYVHAQELKNPGTRGSAIVLERVIKDGWKDSWFQKNPGWTDVIKGTAVGGVFSVIVYLMFRSTRI